MAGYIYTMYQGADPGHGWQMNDPIFGKTPTLGACVPNIRRAVKVGDTIFVISGRVPGERQFIVGEFKVVEKIDALAAYKRFPENRLRMDSTGQVLGNIIVKADGSHHPLDDHDNFERRLENYIVGGDALVFDTPRQQRAARDETLDVLSKVFKRNGERVFDIIGRHRKMDDKQVADVLNWMKNIAE